MKNFIKKNKIILAVVIYMAVLGSAFYFVAGHLLSAISGNNVKIQENLVDREIKEKRLAEIPKMKEQYQTVASEERFFIPLVTEDKAVELIEKLEKLAQSSGNEINIEIQSNTGKVDTSKAKSKKTEDEKQSIRDSLPSSDYLELKINLSGSYNQLLDFIEKFEALQYYSDIVSLDIEFKEEEKKAQSSPSPFAQNTNNMTGSEEVQPVPAKEATLNSSINAVFYLEKNK